jgi:hypothetical protein
MKLGGPATMRVQEALWACWTGSAGGRSPDRKSPRTRYRDRTSIRYVTLERGSRIETGQTRTVLCEWTADGSHVNFGDGPPPSINDFTKAVAAHVLAKG